MPPPFLGSSLQSFPLARIAYLSRDRLLPCSYPPVCGSVSSLVVRLQFRRRPRFHAVAWVPWGLWTSFPWAEAPFPVVLDSSRRSHSVPPASPTSKLCSPRESVRNDFELPLGRWSLLSWAFPLRSFLRPRLGLSTHPIEDRARSRVRGIMGPAAPRCRVRPSRAEISRRPRRRFPVPLRVWPAPPLDGDPFSLGLGQPSELGLLTFRALQCVESGVFS